MIVPRPNLIVAEGLRPLIFLTIIGVNPFISPQICAKTLTRPTTLAPITCVIASVAIAIKTFPRSHFIL
jgi:hypothetical protein